MEDIKLAYCRITIRDLCKTALYIRFLRQAQISILEILHVFLWLKYSPSLNSNINYHFSEVSIQEKKEMNVSRKIGIVVFCMVPAIIGGGIVYAIFNSYMPVFIYELLLLFGAGAFVSR